MHVCFNLFVSPHPYLVCILFVTAIPTSLYILLKCFYLLVFVIFNGAQEFDLEILVSLRSLDTCYNQCYLHSEVAALKPTHS